MVLTIFDQKNNVFKLLKRILMKNSNNNFCSERN